VCKRWRRVWSFLLEYQLAVSTLQVRILGDFLKDFLLVLEVEVQQTITKVLLEDRQEALDHQDRVEEVLTIVLMEVQVKARDLVRIVSKEVWEEQQEATATKEALVDIME
jgi:hypothetical protein